MVSFHELHSLAISSVDRIFSISLSLSSFPLIVSYQWLCICLYLHQRWFKDNATGTIWPAHMPISVGAVIKSLLLPGARWETHGTNKHTTLLSPLCHWETVSYSKFARWQSVFVRKPVCAGIALKPLTPFIKKQHSHCIICWKKKIKHYLLNDFFHEKHFYLFVTECLKRPFATLLLLYPLIPLMML